MTSNRHPLVELVETPCRRGLDKLDQRLIIACTAIAVTGLWLTAELAHAAAHALAARRVIPVNAGISPPAPPAETLLVLGCPTRGNGRPSGMQRWRVDLAARNAGPTTRFVVTGAGEAAVMAEELTTRHGISPSRMTLEDHAANTWQNIGFSASLIEPGGVVRIISDPLHARRAEGYWRLQLPERAGELRPAALYRFGSRPVLKVASALYELVLRSLRYRPDR